MKDMRTNVTLTLNGATSEGGGAYNNSFYRLHDLWLVVGVNNRVLDKNQSRPQMELNTQQASIRISNGHHTEAGSFHVLGTKITAIKFPSTSKPNNTTPLYKEIKTSLTQANRFTLENTELKFYNNSTLLLTMKKID